MTKRKRDNLFEQMNDIFGVTLLKDPSSEFGKTDDMGQRAEARRPVGVYVIIQK